MSFSLIALLPGISGCDKPLISGVAFTVEPNIETLKVQLNFSDEVQTDLGGAFAVNTGGRDYGQIEIEPSSPDNPFNVGFRLNLAIVNEQDYVNLEPVTTLPSGQPIPIPSLNRAFAKVSLKNEINPNFDVYAYVDVVGKEWIGVALTLKFINSKYFPAGLSLSKGFVKAKDGRNQIYGAVFGPKVDNNGNMTVPGGIALFANAKSLITGARDGSGPMSGTSKGEKFVLFQGPQAAHYNEHPEDAIALGEAFKVLMRENSYGNKLK